MEHHSTTTNPTSRLFAAKVNLDEHELPPIFRYESLTSEQLADRLNVPPSWVRDQVRARAEDPLPHIQLGKYVRFLWGSPELEAWLRRRMIGTTNNKRVVRVH